MEPFFTNDAVVLGILLAVLAAIFYTHSLDSPGWKKFYKFVPALLLCYFIPAILYYPLGLIASDWFDSSFYFVKQNDVIVVKPNNTKIKSSGYIGNAGTVLTIASILLSTVVILTR